MNTHLITESGIHKNPLENARIWSNATNIEEWARKSLLACGIASSLLYAAMNVFVPMRWLEYSSASQTVSELSAVDAPTRALWVPFGIIYSVLLAAFGFGVWRSAFGKRPLRIVAASVIASGVIGLAWPPMHQRHVLAAGGGTLTDTLHIVWSAVTVFLFVLAVAFGAAALGNRFRSYSVVTMAVMLAFGALTALDAPRIRANLPTPWLGVWERISIGAFLIWALVLAFSLFDRGSRRSTR